ncbi:MAG TPA: FHA domain-containing protein [Bacteriovoracaceae bacterium]|nr:FHA domain-containing protein [Bacteriovoracaceae bacterium]
MSKNVLVLKHFESPKEVGVYYRLVCLTGASKGESYVLMGNRIVIGRSEKADIRLNDTKSSREHAEITKVGENWVVTDLGSQNGIVVNDKKVTQKSLIESDKLIIGQTVFKFVKVEVTAKKVIKESPEEAGDKKKTMVPILVMVILLLAFFFMGDDKKVEQAGREKRSNSNAQDVTSEYVELERRKAKENKEAKSKLNGIYQRGLREFREGNYYRAIHEFNLALIIMPGDSQAEFYLRKTKEELDNQIEDNMVKAQREEGALKYQHAIKNYCATIRLLYSVPEDKRYKNAVEKIHALESLLGQEPDETDCIKKQRPDQ